MDRARRLGSGAPRANPHARVSSSPVVRNVIRSSARSSRRSHLAGQLGDAELLQQRLRLVLGHRRGLASIAAQTLIVPSGRPAGIDEPSSRFATRTQGFSVKVARGRGGPCVRRRRTFRPAAAAPPTARRARAPGSGPTECPPSPTGPSGASARFPMRSAVGQVGPDQLGRQLRQFVRGLGVGPEGPQHDAQRVSLPERRHDRAPRLGTSTKRTWAATTRECSSSVSTPSRGSGTSTTA